MRLSTKKMVNPWKTYVKLSAVLMGSYGLTRASLTFLNYHAQLMFKLAKHPYVYGVLVFEAMATFIGQVSVLPLIALFGATTTTMITTDRNAVRPERTLLAYKSSQESEG